MVAWKLQVLTRDYLGKPESPVAQVTKQILGLQCKANQGKTSQGY